MIFLDLVFINKLEVVLLTERFEGKFCLLYIIDQETLDLELWGCSAKNATDIDGVTQRINASTLFNWLVRYLIISLEVW